MDRDPGQQVPVDEGLITDSALGPRTPEGLFDAGEFAHSVIMLTATMADMDDGPKRRLQELAAERSNSDFTPVADPSDDPEPLRRMVDWYTSVAAIAEGLTDEQRAEVEVQSEALLRERVEIETSVSARTRGFGETGVEVLKFIAMTGGVALTIKTTADQLTGAVRSVHNLLDELKSLRQPKSDPSGATAGEHKAGGLILPPTFRS